MAFPVTGDLNGQTKVLNVPVVTLQLKFVDKNTKPIPNYQFKIVYRGRTSEIRKANARGIATVRALAGQQLKVIHIAANKFTKNIVTDGATDKGNVIHNDKITQKGPTHEVKTDQAKVTIKFVDEATNKPLSGLSYWTQSTKYGKNPSTTGSDGTRGRTHDSDVGIRIKVLVNENGKEIEKDTIIADNNKNGTAYVYRAKKPKLDPSGAHWHKFRFRMGRNLDEKERLSSLSNKT